MGRPKKKRTRLMRVSDEFYNALKGIKKRNNVEIDLTDLTELIVEEFDWSVLLRKLRKRQ